MLPWATAETLPCKGLSSVGPAGLRKPMPTPCLLARRCDIDVRCIALWLPHQRQLMGVMQERRVLVTTLWRHPFACREAQGCIFQAGAAGPPGPVCGRGHGLPGRAMAQRRSRATAGAGRRPCPAAGLRCERSVSLAHRASRRNRGCLWPPVGLGCEVQASACPWTTCHEQCLACCCW